MRRNTRSQARRQDEQNIDQSAQLHGIEAQMGALQNMQMSMSYVTSGGGWPEGYAGYQQQQPQVHYGHHQQYYQGPPVPDMPPQHHQDPASQQSHHDNTQTRSGRSVRSRHSVASQRESQHSPYKRPSGSKSAAAKDSDIGSDDDDNAPKVSYSKGRKGTDSTNLGIDEMARNALYYFLLHQHKKVPIKKSDLVKNAMNSQYRQFDEVMKKLEKNLDDVFGMRIIRLEKNPKDNNLHVVEDTDQSQSQRSQGGAGGKGKVSTANTCYMLISLFPSDVCDSIMRRDAETDSKKTVLYLLLSTIYMLNRPIDEAMIWQIISGMHLDSMVCGNEEDLRKFLKSEYVSAGYLNMEQQEKANPMGRLNRGNRDDGDQDMSARTEDVPIVRYSWGPRAHVEYLKYPMLKYVANQFSRLPYEFTVQYNMISKEERDSFEKAAAVEEQQLAEARAHQAALASAVAAAAKSAFSTATVGAGKNGSGLNAKQKQGNKPATYSIGDEDTETE